MSKKSFLMYCVKLCLCFLFLIQSCRPSSDKEPQEIILVFNNLVENPSFRDLGMKIKYIDDNLIPHVINVNKSMSQKIFLTRKYIDIAWQDKNKITHNFLFKNGDSIHFTIKDNWLYADIKNREIAHYETNFEKRKQIDLYQDRPSSLESFGYYWELSNNNFSNISGNDLSKDLLSLKNSALHELFVEENYIDSLKKNGELSDDYAHFYFLKNHFIRKKLMLYKSTNIDFDDTLQTKKLFLLKYYLLSDSLDCLPQYTFYDDMLGLYFNHSVLIDTSSRPSIEDIMKIPWLDPVAKQSLAYKYVDYMLQSYSIEDGNSLLNNTNGLLDGWKNHWNTKYKLDQNIGKNWKLTDQVGERLTFGDLLRHCRGELLYIDFWAGWCAPCVREMPESQKLMLEFSEKPVRIVYLSIDKSFDHWKISQKKHLDLVDDYSFYIDSLNYHKAKDALNLSSIPRYILFDKEGKLLHLNAPEPSSAAIRELFNRYM